MADILQFPNKREITDAEQVAKLELRLQEIATEAEYMTDDIIYLQDLREKGKDEAEQIIKDLAHLKAKGTKSELLDEMIEDFIADEAPDTEWLEQFEKGTVYPKKETTQDKWDEIADKTLSASLTLLEEAVNKLKDDFNNDKPKDK
jgi:predicted transcriptional regulator